MKKSWSLFFGNAWTVYIPWFTGFFQPSFWWCRISLPHPQYFTIEMDHRLSTILYRLSTCFNHPYPMIELGLKNHVEQPSVFAGAGFNQFQTRPIGSVCMPYMATFTINIPQMWAYIPYMDSMGGIFRQCSFLFRYLDHRDFFSGKSLFIPRWGIPVAFFCLVFNWGFSDRKLDVKFGSASLWTNDLEILPGFIYPSLMRFFLFWNHGHSMLC